MYIYIYIYKSTNQNIYMCVYMYIYIYIYMWRTLCCWPPDRPWRWPKAGWRRRRATCGRGSRGPCVLFVSREFISFSFSSVCLRAGC